MKNISQIINLTFSFIFLAIFCGVFYFLNLEIDKYNATAEATNIQWQQESSKREEIRSITRVLKSVDNQRVSLMQHFVPSSDLVPFLDNIENMGNQAGAQAETTSVDVSSDNTTLVVSIKASGSFDSIYKFLNLLENSPYELYVVSMDIIRENPQVVASNPVWLANFDLKLLSFLK